MASLRSSEEILAQALTTIQNIHTRHLMYIGRADRDGDADNLDGLFWLAYQFWAMIQNRERELSDAIQAEKHKHKYTNLGFSDSFRTAHDDSPAPAVVQHVLDCWAAIGSSLGIDVHTKPSPPSAQ